MIVKLEDFDFDACSGLPKDELHEQVMACDRPASVIKVMREMGLDVDVQEFAAKLGFPINDNQQVVDIVDDDGQLKFITAISVNQPINYIEITLVINKNGQADKDIFGLYRR